MSVDQTPAMLDVPIGLRGTGTRREFDSMGDVEVPADRYWGAQTQRSLQHFSIGDDRMPKAVYHAYGYVKKACALVERRRRPASRLEERRDRPGRRRDDRGDLDEHFPLFVWQTGSGTQSQHERQRGDLEPCDPVARRHARHAAAGRAQ